MTIYRVFERNFECINDAVLAAIRIVNTKYKGLRHPVKAVITAFNMVPECTLYFTYDALAKRYLQCTRSEYDTAEKKDTSSDWANGYVAGYNEGFEKGLKVEDYRRP